MPIHRFQQRTTTHTAPESVTPSVEQASPTVSAPRGADLEPGRHDAARTKNATLPAHVQHAELLAEAYDREIQQALTDQGYNPPVPPPLLQIRICRERLKSMSESFDTAANREAFAIVKSRYEEAYSASIRFEGRLARDLAAVGPFDAVKRFFGQGDPIIRGIRVQLDIPATSPATAAKMKAFERFISENWSEKARRALLSVHVDHETSQTIIQFGTAEHGPLYVQIPGVLPEGAASDRKIINIIQKLEALVESSDPLAIVNGAYQNLNYTRLLRPARVLRAPSGDLTRLSANVAVTATRKRLSAENTVVLNSAPRDQEQYRSIFPADRDAQGWGTWRAEAPEWNATVTNSGFVVASEASRESLLDGLTQSENVIVIVAHCDGETIFLAEPPPVGTSVTGADIRARKAEIMANQPFVYLFSCHGGDLKRMENFAGVMLECGAAGVVASQMQLGGHDERSMLAKILHPKRDTPPINDVWSAMADLNYYGMEVYLA